MRATLSIGGLLLIASSVVCAGEGPAAAPRMPALSVVLKSAQSREYGRTLDQITTLDEAGPDADKTLIQLLDYYVGAGPSEALAEAITKRGAAILPALLAQRAKAPKCLNAYAALCENKNDADLAARNEFIDRLIDAIKAHKVLRMES
jgi:hypothetical protein